MTDQFELQLRDAFRRAELPPAPDRLRQVLIELPASRRATDRWRPGRVAARPVWRDPLRLAAVVALFAVLSGAALYGIFNWLPQVGTSPSPFPSPTAEVSPTPTASTAGSPFSGPLPEPAAMLLDHPDFDIAFQRSVGPADAPLSDDATLDEIDLGPLEFARDILLAAACLGPGELTVEVRYMNVPGAADPFVGLARPCNGEVTGITYEGSLGGDSLEIQVLAVHVPVGASWRFVIGEFRDSPPQPATFSPISGTDGWWRLWDVQLDAVDPATGMGVGIRVADDVTRLAVWVECAAADSVTLALVHDSPSSTADLNMPIACVAGEPERHELPVAAGEEISIKVMPESPIPAHLYVEANAMPVSEWGEAPALPNELADAPFMASSGSQVALGSLDAGRQTLVAVPGTGPFNRPGGAYAAIPANSFAGPSLRLYAISSGEELTTLAQHEAGTFIATTWVDALHEQVFYTVVSVSTNELEVYRVGLDGSGRTSVASVPSSGARTFATLSLDSASFVIDSCRARTCQRTIVDAATLEPRDVEFTLDAEICDSAGGTDGVVVLRVAESCEASPPEELVVMDFDGNELLRLPDPGSVYLVRTSADPVLLVRDVTDAGYAVVNIADGSSSPLGVDDPTIAPVLGVNLPPDWVLLAPFSGIGDFPIHPSLLLGNPPVLANVVTGETIEMTNLPH